MLVLLLLLSGTGTNGDLTLLLLQLTIGEDLLSAKVLLLEGPQSLFFLLCVLEHLGFLHLESSLMHDRILLLLGESLEVVRLDTVGGQHGLLSGWVLSHEIVVEGKVLLVASLVLHLGLVGGLSISLFLGELEVGVGVGLLHGGPVSSMVLLGIVEELVKVKSLLVVSILEELLLLIVEVLLSDLLFDPVLLL